MSKNKIKHPTIKLVLLGFAVIAIIMFYQWSERDSETNRILIEAFDPHIDERVSYPKNPSTNSTSDFTELIKWLKSRDFDLIESKISGYQKKYESDFNYEYDLFQSYAIFKRDDSTLLNFFNQWIAAKPSSAIALAARGCYYFGLGRKKRGDDWAYLTPIENFVQMNSYYEKSTRDLSRALEINPHLLPAYEVLMAIAMTKGNDKDEEQYFQKALKINPSSREIYRRRMWSLLPRWGGSYIEMNKLAEMAIPRLDENPILATLKGYVAFDQARIAVSENRYEDAITLYNSALEHGDCFDFSLLPNHGIFLTNRCFI